MALPPEVSLSFIDLLLASRDRSVKTTALKIGFFPAVIWINHLQGTPR